MTVAQTLKQRSSVHGEFKLNAACSQALKAIVIEHTVEPLTDVQQEALDVICAKIARIVVGDANFGDHWHDIQGYAKLAENECK